MMAARKTKGSKTQPAATTLKGWQQIATFLGQPVLLNIRSGLDSIPVSHPNVSVSYKRCALFALHLLFHWGMALPQPSLRLPATHHQLRPHSSS
jgi:hypothetical protein